MSGVLSVAILAVVFGAIAVAAVWLAARLYRAGGRAVGSAERVKSVHVAEPVKSANVAGPVRSVNVAESADEQESRSGR
ncbi:MAG TPA: hypothetical protein VLW50_17145 [Streptosporangiaceae bacterium]|nr:hypothetical protein [Streptosporangiaceae bacterium]